MLDSGIRQGRPSASLKALRDLVWIRRYTLYVLHERTHAASETVNMFFSMFIILHPFMVSEIAYYYVSFRSITFDYQGCEAENNEGKRQRI